MIVDVTKVQTVEAEKKPTMYKLTAVGFDINLAKMTVTIESEYKRDIEKYIPLMVGERQGIDFRRLNRTLDEFATDDEGIFSQEELADMKAKDSAMYQKRKNAAKEAGV